MDIEFLEHHPSIAKDITMQITGTDLLSFTNKLVEDKFKKLKESMRDKKKPDKLLTRKDVANIIGVNLATLWRWAKNGTLTPIKIGGKVLYRTSDIEKLLIIDKK